MKKFKLFLMACLSIAAISSCKAPEDVLYLQDLTVNKPQTIQAPRYLSIKPGDKLQINVHSRDEKISDLFNVRTRNGGYSGGYGGNGSVQNTTIDLYAYTVNESGDISFPVIGNVHVAGLSRQEVADHIRDILIEENLVKDPYVSCSFTTAYFYTLGEIGSKGRVILPKDAITIIEAIASAGDIPLTGDRTNIQVLRELNGTLYTFEIDLTKAESVVNSPVYYIQPDDIIYVKPTEKRQYETTVLGNSVRTPSFWIGLVSSVLSLGVAIYAILK